MLMGCKEDTSRLVWENEYISEAMQDRKKPIPVPALS
jgi:hypothetical protein